MTAIKNRFNKAFDKYVCEGDTIIASSEGFLIRARIVRDDDAGRPDQRVDGFWPSLDPNDHGYIGDKSPEDLALETARANDVMAKWKNDEWFYGGVVLNVSKNGVMLERSAASLWGIECNYPKHRDAAPDDFPNSYLTEIANQLLDEALAQGKKTLARLCGCNVEATPIMPDIPAMSLPNH